MDICFPFVHENLGTSTQRRPDWPRPSSIYVFAKGQRKIPRFNCFEEIFCLLSCISFPKNYSKKKDQTFKALCSININPSEEKNGDMGMIYCYFLYFDKDELGCFSNDGVLSNIFRRKSEHWSNGIV